MNISYLMGIPLKPDALTEYWGLGTAAGAESRVEISPRIGVLSVALFRDHGREAESNVRPVKASRFQ